MATMTLSKKKESPTAPRIIFKRAEFVPRNLDAAIEELALVKRAPEPERQEAPTALKILPKVNHSEHPINGKKVKVKRTRFFLGVGVATQIGRKVKDGMTMAEMSSGPKFEEHSKKVLDQLESSEMKYPGLIRPLKMRVLIKEKPNDSDARFAQIFMRSEALKRSHPKVSEYMLQSIAFSDFEDVEAAFQHFAAETSALRIIHGNEFTNLIDLVVVENMRAPRAELSKKYKRLFSPQAYIDALLDNKRNGD